MHELTPGTPSGQPFKLNGFWFYDDADGRRYWWFAEGEQWLPLEDDATLEPLPPVTLYGSFGAVHIPPEYVTPVMEAAVDGLEVVAGALASAARKHPGKALVVAGGVLAVLLLVGPRLGRAVAAA